MSISSRSMHAMLVAATAVAVPLAWALESALRWFLLPPEFELVREHFLAVATMAAWGLAALTGAVSLVSIALGRRTLRSVRVRSSREGERLRTRTFLWSASLPQFPAVGATLCGFFGSTGFPVLTAVLVSTATILWLGFQRPPFRP